MIDINQVIADMTGREANRLVEDKIRIGEDPNITENDIKSIYKNGVLGFVSTFIEIYETCERTYLDESYKLGDELDKSR